MFQPRSEKPEDKKPNAEDGRTQDGNSLTSRRYYWATESTLGLLSDLPIYSLFIGLVAQSILTATYSNSGHFSRYLRGGKLMTHRGVLFCLRSVQNVITLSLKSVDFTGKKKHNLLLFKKISKSGNIWPTHESIYQQSPGTGSSLHF